MIDIKVKADINFLAEIKNKLQPNGEVHKYLNEQALQRMGKYVPKDTGNLIASGKVNGDNKIVYDTPYAQKMYYGISSKGKPIKFNGGPQRGSYWDKKMLAAEGEELTADLSRFVNGK